MATIDRPRFKQELVAEPLEDGTGRYVDLMDPDGGNLFRFYEVEYALACAMDGERDVAGIVRWATEELGVTPSAKEVETVIATLGDLGYLDVRPGADTAPARPVETAPTQPTQPAKPANVAAAAKPAAKAPVQEKQDEDLARGIVVGKQSSPPPMATEDFELGASGGAAPPKAEDLPKAPDLALGASGSSGSSVKSPPAQPVADIALGASGATKDLSTDLAGDFSLNDVKEAVRASKVMTAVEIPADLQAELDKKPAVSGAQAQGKKNKDDVPTEKLPDPKQVQAAADKRAADEKAAADKKAADAKAAADKKAADDKKAAETKAAADKKAADDKAAAAAKKAENDAKAKAGDAKAKAGATTKPADEKKPATAVQPPAPKPGVSPVLIVLLILAVVGGGVFAVWKFVLDKPSATTENTPKPAPPPLPPAPPPAPASKLALDTPAAVDVKAPAAGTIESIEANDKVVKSGDAIAMLTGNAPVKAQVDGLKKDADKAAAAVDAAQKELDGAKDDAAKKAAQDKVDAAKKASEKAATALTAKQGDLDKLTVKAPSDGKLTAVAKKDQKVTDADVVAKVQADAMIGATFANAPAGKYVAGSPATLDTKDGKKLACTVADVQGGTVKVSCPADPSLSAGADVTLE